MSFKLKTSHIKGWQRHLAELQSSYETCLSTELKLFLLFYIGSVLVIINEDVFSFNEMKFYHLQQS